MAKMKLWAIMVAIIVIIAIIGALAYYLTSSGPTEVVQLKAAYVVPIENAISLCEIPYFQQNLFKNYGKYYTLDLLKVQGTPDVVNALAAGEVNIGHISNIAFAASTIGGTVPSGLTVIATEIYDAYPGYFSFSFLTLASSNINSVADLKGKKIGVNAMGTAVYVVAATTLKKYGIDPKTDVTFVEIPFPAMAEALEKGTIDAGVFPPAYYWPAMKKGIFKKIGDSREGFDKPYITLFLVVRNDFLKAHRNAIKAFLEDYVRLLHYILDPGNREQLLNLVSEHFNVPKEKIEYWLTSNDFYRPVDARTDVSALQFGIDKLYEIGLINQKLNVSQYVDNSLLP